MSLEESRMGMQQLVQFGKVKFEVLHKDAGEDI